MRPLQRLLVLSLVSEYYGYVLDRGEGIDMAVKIKRYYIDITIVALLSNW